MRNDKKAKTTSLVVLLLSVFLLSAFAGVQFVGKVSAAGAYDWPMFRHDLWHTGFSTSSAPSTNQTLWTYTTSNWIASSPAVADGKVCIGSYDRKVYCLDAATGAHIWNFTTGGIVGSSPAVVDGRVYVGSDDDNIYCLDAANGALLWNYSTGGDVVSCPTVSDGRVYVGSKSDRLYCLNASTGAYIWSYMTSGDVISSPAIADGKVYVGSYDNRVYCLNALTGAYIWNYTTGGWVWSSPAVADGKVYVGSNDTKVYALNALTGAVVWNFTTGAEVISSPAVADGKVYVGSYDDKVYCLNAATGALVWNFLADDYLFSSPALADGKVYIGSFNGTVYCLNAATGSIVWSYAGGAHFFSSPAVANGVVYIGSLDRKVYAFSAPAITLTPTSQAPGASVSVSGASFGATKAVGIGCGAEVQAINETMDMNGPYGTSGGPYIGYLSHVPMKPGTYRKAINISGNVFSVVDTDAGNGTYTVAAALRSYFVNGTIDYVTGKVTLFLNTPLSSPTQYVNLANYTYYQFSVTPPAGVTTDVSGSFTTSTIVPYMSSGSYTVTAIDASGNSATSSLSVTAGTHPPPAATAFSNVAVMSGWTWYFFVHSNGGVGTHTYQWYESSTMLQGQTSMVLPVTKNTPGTYKFYCKVTDSEGLTTYSNAVTLTVR